jgi:Uma2 family endonuclease
MGPWMSATTSAMPIARIEYPESDGKPLGETDVHRREILEIIAMLQRFFAALADVYVSGNLMFYYEEGNPGAVVSPDVFVVKGVPNRLRRVYKLWEEQQAPAVVIEITSRSTRLEDKGNKRALYAMLGVREYFMFDPLAEYLTPSLQGFVLADDEYVSLKPAVDGSLASAELGLRLVAEGAMLRLIDGATGERLLRTDELEAARRAEAEARRAEAEARRAAEERAAAMAAEVERLRAELARLRGDEAQ